MISNSVSLVDNLLSVQWKIALYLSSVNLHQALRFYHLTPHAWLSVIERFRSRLVRVITLLGNFYTWLLFSLLFNKELDTYHELAPFSLHLLILFIFSILDPLKSNICALTNLSQLHCTLLFFIMFYRYMWIQMYISGPKPYARTFNRDVSALVLIDKRSSGLVMRSWK